MMPYAGDLYYFLHGDENAGGKPPLVLIHGAGGDHLYWPPEIRRLVGRPIYAIDLPGHGKSPGRGEQTIQDYASKMREWLRAIGYPRAIFGGHSMGGAIALTLALDYQDCVVGLVLVGSGACLKVNTALLEMLADPEGYSQAVEAILRWSFSRQTPTRLVQLAARRMSATNPSVLYQDLVACDKFDVSERLAEINLPTLVICGSVDKMTPLRLSEQLAAGIRGAQLEVIPDGGHMVMLEQPQAVAAAMAKFLSASEL
jgi:pimeloyl-ACP methyl ester carboxylesterase